MRSFALISFLKFFCSSTSTLLLFQTFAPANRLDNLQRLIKHLLSYCLIMKFFSSLLAAIIGAAVV